MRLVLGRDKLTTSTATRARPDGGNSTSTSTSISVSANSIHYTAIDVRSVRIPVKHLSIVVVTIRTIKVDIVISSDEYIPLVRENREK